MKINLKHIDKTLVKPQLSHIAPRYADALYLRWDVYDFMREIADTEYDCSVVEIGPQTLGGYSSLPYKDIMPPFFSLGEEFIEKGCKYLSCDKRDAPEIDIQEDAMNLVKVLGKESVDVIIALEVMEHMELFWQVPQLFHDLLIDNGRIYISVPFWCHHHDPHPDYWRFTEEGLNLLFGDLFDIEITKLLWRADNGQTPVHLTLKGVKK